jgi:hypothetical protein
MTEAELKQVVVQPGTQVVMVTQATQRACECTAGWVLFGVGFVVSGDGLQQEHVWPEVVRISMPMWWQLLSGQSRGTAAHAADHLSQA